MPSRGHREFTTNGRCSAFAYQSVRFRGFCGAATDQGLPDLETFLRNHLGQIVSVDFFTVAAIRLRVLLVFLVVEHRRREVLQFNVTDHPTSGWVGQQIVEAFADRGRHAI
jgi:hypothetical protein